jgi:hypothetical protein
VTPILLLLLAGAGSAPATEEIVVTARKKRCEMSIADHVISDAQFRARAAEWAKGIPVRVRAPTAADYKCLAKITFRLADHGVKVVNFGE